MSSKIAPSEVDFWLDTERYDDYIVDNPLDPSKRAISFSIDLIRLASIRKAVSNFVRILTRKSIPVYFNNVDVNRNTYGKIIHISAHIKTKIDFDVTVGLALHEGAHTLLSDFDVVKDAWANLPPKLLQMSDALDIRRTSIEKFIHSMWNIVEDRYIDNYVFNRAPGYRGYYVALYDRFFNDFRVDELLKSDEYRWPSLDSYLFRVSNLTNINTDLTALPRLDEIADIIDLSNINRLSTTMKRIEVAFDIIAIVLDCLDKEPPSNSGGGGISQQITATFDGFFGSGGEEDENGEEGEQGEGSEKSETEPQEEASKDAGTKLIEEISDVIGGRDPTPEKFKENEGVVSKISENETDDLKKVHEEIAKKQRQFLMGQIPKDSVSPEQKELLDLIEQHGIVLVRVGAGLLPGDNKDLRVDCIVVQKMTKELIFRGQDVFPLSSVMKMGEDNPQPLPELAGAVKKGILLGTKLGRKLQLRREINSHKSLRKKSGKINKRQLYEASFDAEDLFYKVKIEAHNQATLHITVDSSGSMAGEKWLRTMTAVVAICKAASMIDNVHVTVSFRSTQAHNTSALPYVVMAYDSRHDKFSKVKQLFPYLVPNGFTPEGLAFEAIMDLFEGITPDEEERYFLNLSDGEPYYHLTMPQSGICISYAGEVGVSHTKDQVNKIRRKGVEILSYFIESDENIANALFTPFFKANTSYSHTLRDDFQKMYGRNAKFINVRSIVDLARTMNGLFLARGNEKTLDKI
jgi:hypothetical protein